MVGPPSMGHSLRLLLLGVATIRIAVAQLEEDPDSLLHTAFPPDVDTCPAGLAGADCRAASLDYEWKTFEGCAIPAGGDIGEPEMLTVEEAQQRCGSVDLCQGFTFEGSDPEGPLSGDPIWAHFKDSFDCVEAPWITYRKVKRRIGAPAPPPPPPPPPSSPPNEEAVLAEEDGEGVALCLTGQVRMLENSHLALEQYLLSVLRPDVFLYGPKIPGSFDGAPELYGMEDYVKIARWETEDIRKHLYRETRNAGRVIDLEYLEVQGNWFGNQCLQPALRDNRPGSAICLYYNQQKCLEMIQEHEGERGQQYEYVVVSRFDFRWLAPHPPLDLLKSQDAVWIPSGSDWEGGINDRHAFMRRKYASAYLGAWRLVTKGEAKDVMLDTLGSMKVNGYPGPNTECFLRARLAYYNVTVARFPSVAYLVCTQRSKSRWTQCSGTASNNAPGWLYKEEMEHSTRIAQCVRSSWSLRKMNDCRYDISHLYRGIR